MKAEILSYTRSRGIFAGVSIEGVVIHRDDDTNEAVYGEPVSAKKVLLEERYAVPSAGRGFIDALTSTRPWPTPTAEGGRVCGRRPLVTTCRGAYTTPRDRVRGRTGSARIAAGPVPRTRGRPSHDRTRVAPPLPVNPGSSSPADPERRLLQTPAGGQHAERFAHSVAESAVEAGFRPPCDPHPRGGNRRQRRRLQPARRGVLPPASIAGVRTARPCHELLAQDRVRPPLLHRDRGAASLRPGLLRRGRGGRTGCDLAPGR